MIPCVFYSNNFHAQPGYAEMMFAYVHYRMDMSDYKPCNNAPHYGLVPIPTSSVSSLCASRNIVTH